MTDLVFAVPFGLERPTGGNLYDRHLIDALPARGWRVRTLAMPEGFPDPAPAAIEAALAALAAAAAEAVVLVDGLVLGALPAGRLAPFAHRLVELCHHPLALETGLAPERAAELARSERAVLAAVAAVVVTSPATAAVLTAEFGVAPAKIAVALPGTRPRPRALGSGAEPMILAVGSLIPRKGHDVLIDALAELRGWPWRAAIVGSADLDPAWAEGLRRRVTALGLDDRIEFRGAMPPAALDGLFAAADLFVLLSSYEGYGMAYAEALSAGLPIVATTGGAIPETVPAAAAILVPPGDRAAATAAIGLLLDDRVLRARLASGALAAAASLPRWEDAAATVAAALDRVAAR